ncbi:MAG: Rieske 2Fe-2S domain-containing protein [Chthoniobacterales bacterium]|jgi:menaquinol-cytochrome c reductase iron-sulfur subunit
MAAEDPHPNNDSHDFPKFDYRSSRRDFLLKLGIGLDVIAGAMISIPIIGFFISAVIKRAGPTWISLGPVDQFKVGTTRMVAYENPHRIPADGLTAHIPCWVKRNSEQDFKVFAVNCTHLGCPVRWFEQSKLFLCPCHGGAFYEDGSHAAGPPPRGLYEYAFKIEKGELSIKAGVLPTLSDPGTLTDSGRTT